MRILRHPDSLTKTFKGGCVALGNFDGVHLGHQRVIGAARAMARDLGVPLGVMTFEPHPRRFFNPTLPPFTLTPLRVKTRLIEDLDVDYLYVQAFDQTFACLEADRFIRDILIDGLGVSHVVVGQDYAFGHRRSGTVATLQAMGAALGFGVSAVAPVMDTTGEIISSTRIRTAIENGDMALAQRLMGHDWEVIGRVEHGEKRGRTIGFPTANINLGDIQPPAQGVYAISAGIDLGKETIFMPGVANFGRRPTFGQNAPLLEVHLFTEGLDLYEHHLRVRFHHHIRPEVKFDSLEMLKTRIALDIAEAQVLLGCGEKGLQGQ